MLYKIHDSKWSKIAAEFSGMTENDVKNKFYSTLKSIASKVQHHPTLLTKKKDLIQFVDVGMIYEELLPCKHNKTQKKIVGSKRTRPTNIVSEDSAGKDSRTEENDYSALIWSNNHILKTEAFTKTLSNMVWGEIDTNQTSISLSRNEIKSDP